MDEQPLTEEPLPLSTRVLEVALVFLKLGLTAFGGPAAHVGMMRREVVDRRRWVDDQRFLDLLGATNLIPGPNSTEMVIHLGYGRAGIAGLIVGGVSFIFPAMVLVTILSWAYIEFGSTPSAEWLLYGIKPVVIAIIAGALYSLGRRALKNVLTAVVGALVLIGFLMGLDVLILLFGGALLVTTIIMMGRALKGGEAPLVLAAGSGLSGLLGGAATALQSAPFTLVTMFLAFLKIGSVMFGSGYTLLAFLQDDLVMGYGWLTEQQLIDAIAIGQMTPGPILTTSTFIGYILGEQFGTPPILTGVLATLGIFLPSFIFVGLTHRLVYRMRESEVASAFLDGANAAALGVMAGVTIELGRAAFVDPITIGLGVVAALLVFRFRVDSFLLVLLGAAAGLVTALARGALF